MSNTSAARSPNAPNVASGRVRQLSDDDAQKLLDAGKTIRAKQLAKLQAYVEGNAYDGRPHFFDDSVPLQQRKPIVQYPLVRIGIESNVAFAMGEGRFPTFLSLSSENDAAFDPQLGLNATESANLDAFNVKLLKLGRLERTFRQAYRMAQASRSVAIVIGFRGGLPFADLVWSKLCTPSFDDPTDPGKCTRLEIRYRYVERWRDPLITNGEWWPRVFEFLRVIDDTYDTTYLPVAIWDVTDAGAVDRQSPTKSVIKHGFGLCPVHWYARNLESVVGSNFDGVALHDGSTGLIEQLDYAISQRHRAALYAGDPQTIITGTTDDDWANIGATGPTLRPEEAGTEGGQWRKGFDGLASVAAGNKAVKRGVMHPWRITDPNGKVDVLTLPGDALTALDNDGKDLANKLADALAVTLLDPSMFGGGGDLSGRTLAFIFSKQINRVSQDREDLGRCCMLPVFNLYYRALLANSSGVYLPGLAKVLPTLKRFYLPVQGTQTVAWFSPQIEVKWGDYFEPSDVDEATRVSTALSAYNGKILTLQSALEHIRSVFSISNVDQYAKTLTDEVAQRQADAVATQQALAKPPGANNPSAQQSPAAAPPASPPNPSRARGKKS